MPQIYMIIGLGKEAVLSEDLDSLKVALVRTVEKEFGLEGWDDVAFTAVRAINTHNEKDVQIEIRYTAGKDEYNQGGPFDPPVEKQEKLGEAIHSLFISFLAAHGLVHLSLSVWCKPYYNSAFKAWD